MAIQSVLESEFLFLVCCDLCFCYHFHNCVGDEFYSFIVSVQGNCCLILHCYLSIFLCCYNDRERERVLPCFVRHPALA